MKKKILLLFIFLLFSFSVSFSQGKFQKIFEVSVENGPLISNGKPWADEISSLVSYQGLDMRMGWRKIENNHYNYLYRYPTFGLGFSTALNYHSEIGRPQGLYTFAEFPIGKSSIHKRFNISYFYQIGLGFNLNPYDSLDNPINQFVGSELNAYINMGFKSNYRLNDRFGLFATIGLKHYSNGAAKKPNAGINFVPFALGLRTNLTPEFNLPQTKPDFPELEKRTIWNFALYLGSKNYEIGDPSYFRGGIGINYLWDANYKYRFGVGMDLFVAPGMERRYPDQKFTAADGLSYAFVASWEWKLSDRLYMPIGLGAYLIRSELNQESSWFYERIGMRYSFDNNLFAGIQIKAHKARADFFEFTLGYTLSRKYFE